MLFITVPHLFHNSLLKIIYNRIYSNCILAMLSSMRHVICTRYAASYYYYYYYTSNYNELKQWIISISLLMAWQQPATHGLLQLVAHSTMSQPCY